MILKLFSVYDSGVEAYLPPILFKSKGEFLRAFEQTVNDSKSNMAKYPSQFVAFEIGSWNDESCTFDIYKAPVSLGVALEFVRSPLVDEKARPAAG